MASSFDLDKLRTLASRLNLSFKSGHITLEDQRMVLLHTDALGALRRELVETLGLDRARGVLTRMGYASGQRDAQMVRRLMPEASDEEIMSLGPQLHSLEGSVDVTPVHFQVDVAKGRFFGEFIWENSYEAQVHREQLGGQDEPMCWMQIGYASGYTSGVLGRRVVYKEVQCIGRGDTHCLIVGRPVEDWGEEIEPELRFFRPDHVAEQIAELQAQVAHLRYSLDDTFTAGEMVGVSEAFRATTEMIRKAANSTVTVLLLGETGVGKEMYARLLHNLSPRANNPFVAVNCAAIPEELVESELFGVEKGAYTGAQKSRPGRFERAHGGTLFLDEVGELSASAQAKLLRVLQEGEFERVGDTQTRSIDVRLVTATNVDLQQAVQAGRFRADLYYRLNTYPVVVPPLRARREDIPLLVSRFLDKYNARHGKRVTGVTEAAMKALRDYDWPGNIRELENVIERGVIIVPNGGKIDVTSLFPCTDFGDQSAPPAGVGQPPAAETSQAAEASPGVEAAVAQVLEGGVSLESLETELMKAAVARSEGNLSCAARLLGMTRAQLAYRLKKRS